MRIGIHYGPCLGGIVGEKMPRYHLFGCSIDVAQQLEQGGSVDGVLLSNAAAKMLGMTRPGPVDFTPDQWTEVEGEGDGMNITVENYKLAPERLEEIRLAVTGDSLFGPLVSGSQAVNPSMLVKRSRAPLAPQPIPESFITYDGECGFESEISGNP